MTNTERAYLQGLNYALLTAQLNRDKSSEDIITILSNLSHRKAQAILKEQSNE